MDARSPILDAPLSPEAAAPRATPMMEQFIEIKAANPDCLLFYRMGDFYELFFADAEVASRALGITLTKRGKHLGEDVPMCGVPVERAEDYLHRLIALGHRVAVCEQTEDPAEARRRGGKSVVRRDVVRLVTPGTLTEDTLLDARRNNYLLAVAHGRASGRTEAGQFALACVDISTGEFTVATRERAGVSAEIARLAPGEVILADALYSDEELGPFWRTLPAVSPLGRDVFDDATAERRLVDFFAVATVASFGPLSRLELCAAAACVTYVERTQLGKRPSLSTPSREASGATLAIDAATRANLELTATLAGERRGSLLGAIDRTVTAAGSRLLAARLSAPLTDPAAINARLDAVTAFIGESGIGAELRQKLRASPDLARALARLAVERGGPRDLAAIRNGLVAARAIAAILAPLAAGAAEIAAAAAAMCALDPTLEAELARALDDDLPLQKRDGGFIRPGYDAALDAARALRDDTRRVMAALQARYAEETEIRALKIRHNNVIGFFVEVAATHAERLRAPPLDALFIHRQSLAGQVRFTTAELVDLQSKISTAADRAHAIELDRFESLAALVLAQADAIKTAGQALAAIDVASSLALLAASHDYVRPEITEALDFAVEGGRHPVVEQALAGAGGGAPFISNDCDLSPSAAGESGRIWLVTGPNMGGKSTFLRQNALIVVLAQMGSFVPARAACIGVVDRLFSRVGAADDLARGCSTFMVEMVETAAILNQATERSLVILDEIGRGTATFDGLSIAWASVEHLHDANRCRALFATHFHELTALAARLPRLHNATLRVKEWKGEVVFLHEVVPGAADRSYGIQVAKLAGLPARVIARARKVLAELEAEDRARPARRVLDDLPLFAERAPARATADDDKLAALAEALAAIQPDEMSPKEALEALYRLKQQAAAARE